MKMRNIILPLLLSVAAAAPAVAATVPVEGYELNRFIGTTVRGHAWTPLGIVSAVNRNTGVIAVVGRHGELASIDNSLLYRTGLQLRAPELTRGDIARRSFGGMSRVPLTRGEIIIEEPVTIYDFGE